MARAQAHIGLWWHLSPPSQPLVGNMECTCLGNKGLKQHGMHSLKIGKFVSSHGQLVPGGPHFKNQWFSCGLVALSCGVFFFWIMVFPCLRPWRLQSPGPAHIIWHPLKVWWCLCIVNSIGITWYGITWYPVGWPWVHGWLTLCNECLLGCLGAMAPHIPHSNTRMQASMPTPNCLSNIGICMPWPAKVAFHWVVLGFSGCPLALPCLAFSWLP